MKLVCTIGTQGFMDGRRFYRGDVYEVDDETSSALVEAGYAQVAETDVPTHPVKEPEVVDTPKKSAEPEDSDDADKDSAPKPAKKKNVNKRR